MEEGLVNIIERLGSLGLLGWLLVWATGTAWPRLSSHLDVVSGKLDRIGDQLTGLRDELSELRSSNTGVSGSGVDLQVRQHSAGLKTHPTKVAVARGEL
ncbi:MAG: hypothetical protein M3R04_01030 [bacterium]|nr:hypothetical protein [bacterium]